MQKTCQQGVILQPNNSKALWLLGNAQLGRYDNDINNNNSEKCLAEAEQCFRVSLELEGKPGSGGVLHEFIKEQRWWKERHNATTKTSASSNAPSNQRVSPTKHTPVKGRGRGTTAAKTTAPATKPAGRQPASKTPTSTTPAAKAASTARKNSTPKAGTSKAAPAGTSRQTTTKSSTNPPPKQNTSKTNINTASSTKAPNKTPQRTCSHSDTSKTEATPNTSSGDTRKQSTTGDPVGPPNVPSYHPRLGLARVLSRRGNEKCQKFYQEVIKMAPDFHDAYIELGDMLVKTDPLGAVDVYSKYPFPDPSTYDDAYLHGEIVRHLVKSEKFEDERLSRSMIALGRVMGLSVIEKYVDMMDSKLKYRKLLMNIYAGVHRKNVEDPDLQSFFKFKCWI